MFDLQQFVGKYVVTLSGEVVLVEKIENLQNFVIARVNGKFDIPFSLLKAVPAPAAEVSVTTDEDMEVLTQKSEDEESTEETQEESDE